MHKVPKNNNLNKGPQMRKKLSKFFYISKTTRLNIEMTNHYDAVQYGTVWHGWDGMRCSTV